MLLITGASWHAIRACTLNWFPFRTLEVPYSTRELLPAHQRSRKPHCSNSSIKLAAPQGVDSRVPIGTDEICHPPTSPYSASPCRYSMLASSLGPFLHSQNFVEHLDELPVPEKTITPGARFHPLSSKSGLRRTETSCLISARHRVKSPSTFTFLTPVSRGRITKQFTFSIITSQWSFYTSISVKSFFHTTDSNAHIPSFHDQIPLPFQRIPLSSPPSSFHSHFPPPVHVHSLPFSLSLSLPLN